MHFAVLISQFVYIQYTVQFVKRSFHEETFANFAQIKSTSDNALCLLAPLTPPPCRVSST